MEPHVTGNPSVNFAYLAHHDARLVALASDPRTCIVKPPLFAAVLAKRAAAKVGLLPLANETQQTRMTQRTRTSMRRSLPSPSYGATSRTGATLTSGASRVQANGDTQGR
jgi:hypothetical protein